jgi:hypothetical protein
MRTLMRTGLLTLILPGLILVVAANTFGQIDPSVFYRITAKHSGKCLAVAGGENSLRNGDRVIQWDCLEEDNQKWQIIPVGEGFYKILAKHSGKGLDVFGGLGALGNGAIVEQWDYNGAANQMWSLTRDGEGYYTIIARHSGKSLDINGGPGATGNGPYAQQWDNLNAGNQKFRLTALAVSGSAGTDIVTGGFSYKDTEADTAGRNSTDFPRPIIGCLVQVWRAGALAITTETNNLGTFNITVPHMPAGTDTTVLIYATNAAAQVLAGYGPYYVRRSRLSQGSATLDFSETFETAEEVRSFNAAQDIRLAFDFANARRDPREKEVIPKVDVSFNDIGLLMTHYNPPGSGLVIGREHNSTDLVIMHEYAHFLEDKIGSFLLLPSLHDGCNATQRCLIPEECANLPGLPAQTQLINSPENAWMEGFADYFAMAVKRANPAGRFNLTDGGTTPEAELDNPSLCPAVGRAAFDGRTINGEMVENYVASVLWAISESPGSDRSVFEIFDHELDGSATHMLPNIKRFHDAWVARGLDHARLDGILTQRRIPSVPAHGGT